MMFTLALPALLGLAMLGVDLGNLYIARDKLNLLNRSAAATAINIRALQGWAPLACDGQQNPSLGYKCANTIDQPAPQGEKYAELVQEIEKTLTSQLEHIFPESVSSSANRQLIEFKLPSTRWSSNFPASTRTDAVYNLKTDTFQLQVRYPVKTILLSQLASLLNIEVSSLCEQPSDTTAAMENRCWVTSSDSASTSSTTKARVIMLLDTSGSMQDKKTALITAAASFIDYFNPFKDEIGIIYYGTGVKEGMIRPSSFATAGTGGLLQIKDSVANLEVGGQTNPCDALIEAADEEIIPTPDADQASPRTFVVFFTDGAPNVYRLRFCNPTKATGDCEQPSDLKTIALSDDDNDWYGWTVKWGRRETHPLSTTNNPFYGHPMIRDKNGNTGFDTTANPVKFRINEHGEFMIRKDQNSPWCNMEKPSAQCPDTPYTKVFKPLTPAEDNYLWNGPSYLVNRDENKPIASVTSLIDRVGPGFKTCGIPETSAVPNNPDQFSYNHSLYFASRVVDDTWRLDRPLFGSIQSRLVHLEPPAPGSLRPSPLNFDYPNPGNDLKVSFYGSESAPTVSPPFAPPARPKVGCLEALDAAIPVQNSFSERLFVGQGSSSFWSNTSGDSIEKVGEIIKTAELPYYCAIRAADYLRQKKNVTVFAVGLGKPAGDFYGNSCEDPMQNALDFDRRKDFFLQRLALSPEAIKFKDAKTTSLVGATWQPTADFRLRLRSIPASCANHPLKGQSVYLGFSETPVTGMPQSCLARGSGGACQDSDTNIHGVNADKDYFSQAIGGYYPTNDPSQLKAHFGAIAKQILFRLSL
jgi:hypothetical protein